MRTKLSMNIGKPKELWEALKSLGLPSKAKKESKTCLQNGEILSFDAKEKAETFKNYFTSLAEDLVKKLPVTTDKFGMESVKDYYKDLDVDHRDFNFQSINKEHVHILLQKNNESEASGIDNISGKFLKDGASILSGPISDLCNPSILLPPYSGLRGGFRRTFAYNFGFPNLLKAVEGSLEAYYKVEYEESNSTPKF